MKRQSSEKDRGPASPRSRETGPTPTLEETPPSKPIEAPRASRALFWWLALLVWVGAVLFLWGAELVGLLSYLMGGRPA